MTPRTLHRLKNERCRLIAALITSTAHPLIKAGIIRRIERIEARLDQIGARR